MLLICDCPVDVSLTNNNNKATPNAMSTQSATTNYGSVSDKPSSSMSSNSAIKTPSNGSTQPTKVEEKSPTTVATTNSSGNASKGSSTATGSGTSATVSGSSELADAIGSCSETARHCLWVAYAMLLLSCQIPYSIVHYQVSVACKSSTYRAFKVPST